MTEIQFTLGKAGATYRETGDRKPIDRKELSRVLFPWVQQQMGTPCNSCGNNTIPRQVGTCEVCQDGSEWQQ